MAWKIHISSPTPSVALAKIHEQRTALLAEGDRSKEEAGQIEAGVQCMAALLRVTDPQHEVMGWLEGRVGPRYQMGTEQIANFGCHLSSRQRGT